MIKLEAEELQSNYETFIQLINDNFTGDRKTNLLKLYDDLKDNIIFAPASSYKQFHGAYTGGYLIHILNVVNYSKIISKLWGKLGGTINYTEEELLFAALNHDLGKLGDIDTNYYQINNSKWHIENQGKYFTKNSKLIHMEVPDKGLFMLQQYGLILTENEYLGIKLHDGMFLPGNELYWNKFIEEDRIRNNIIYILHQADFMATQIERDKEKIIEMDDLPF
ncbi:MAG: hypothetical protein M0R17_08515 [Candidatus Omnitrophica bacterium]|jgi:hypothetical protein|nr:hypothetical protein [Candidatus Omnitrophota bacterium]